MQQLQAIGFDDIDASHVFTSIGAARTLVAQRQLQPLLLLQPQAAAEFAGLPLQPPHNAVVVGLAKDGFNYENMNEVCAYCLRCISSAVHICYCLSTTALWAQALHVLLDNPDAPLIAMHKGRLFRDPSGALLLGPGPFVAALEYATGRTAEVWFVCIVMTSHGLAKTACYAKAG